MAIFLLALACAVPAWKQRNHVRVAEMACGAARAVAVEVKVAPEVRVFVAGRADAEVVINGGLFDGRERPMGPARGEGRDWPASPRRACSGILAAGGGRVEIRRSCALEPWMTDVVAGFPALLHGGRAVAIRCNDPVCRGVNRRTAVGVAPGRLLLLAVDEPGLSLRDVAGLMAQLGAREAINLDGGGSTALSLDGEQLVRGRLEAPIHLAIAIASRNLR